MALSVLHPFHIDRHISVAHLRSRPPAWMGTNAFAHELCGCRSGIGPIFMPARRTIMRSPRWRPSQYKEVCMNRTKLRLPVVRPTPFDRHCLGHSANANEVALHAAALPITAFSRASAEITIPYA